MDLTNYPIWHPVCVDRENLVPGGSKLGPGKCIICLCFIFFSQSGVLQTSLAVQWLRLRASTAGGTGSSPGQRTKIQHAAQCGKKKKKKKNQSPSPGWQRTWQGKGLTMGCWEKWWKTQKNLVLEIQRQGHTPGIKDAFHAPQTDSMRNRKWNVYDLNNKCI